jgi:methylmalonyl-CoA/ethylmalonyl-CoA epimerase
MAAMSPEVKSLGQIAIPCRDVERATSFYRDTLGLPFLFAAPPNLAFLMVGDVRLMLASEEKEGSTLYIRVPDCTAALEAVRDRVQVVDEPHLIARLTDHELWMAFFRDSEGNLLAFMEERPFSD